MTTLNNDTASNVEYILVESHTTTSNPARRVITLTHALSENARPGATTVTVEEAIRLVQQNSPDELRVETLSMVTSYEPIHALLASSNPPARWVSVETMHFDTKDTLDASLLRFAATAAMPGTVANAFAQQMIAAGTRS